MIMCGQIALMLIYYIMAIAESFSRNIILNGSVVPSSIMARRVDYPANRVIAISSPITTMCGNETSSPLQMNTVLLKECGVAPKLAHTQSVSYVSYQ